MRKILLASVSAAVLSSSVVMAADMPVKARPLPLPPPVATWTGWYAGLNAGYAWANTDPAIASLDLSPFFVTGTTGPVPKLSPQGFIGGGQVGYNYQSGQWVIGGELDFSGMDVSRSATVSPFFTGKSAPDSVSWSSRYDWLFTARLRGGLLITPNWLVYATGGLAVTHVKDSVQWTNPSLPLGLVSWSGDKTLTGGTIGGGIETLFAPNWIARLEYLYAKFDDTTPDLIVAGAGRVTPGPGMFTFNHDLNIVRFAVNYKFDWR